MFVGVAMLAKTLVPPLASVLGWPATKIGGAAGKLARGNAMRNPTRTASTAAALMIGLALVTLVAVLAAGLKSTFESSVNELFNADYALTATNNFSPISIGLRGSGAQGAGRAGASPAYAPARAEHSAAKSTSPAWPPDISKVINVKWQVGSPAVPGGARRRAARSSRRTYAKELDLHVGSPIAVETPTGKVMHLQHPRHLRAAQRRLAVRRHHDLHAAL